MSPTLKLKFSLQQAFSIIVSCLFGWICSYLATNIYKNYTFGLFIWLPFVLGATSTFIHAYKNQTKRLTLRNNAYLTLLIFCLGLLLFAWEGLICLLMAAPIGLFFTYIGFLVGYFLAKTVKANHAPLTIIILLLSVPSLMSFEYAYQSTDDFHSVVTTIEINAPQEKVWQNLIAFPQLNEPTEFIFRTGIAYPINATIMGHGVGAIRHCNFTTGSFIEPITVWDEPKLLRFSVDEQPEPMKEISPYEIHPTHLHGYWISKQGQFKLTALSNGHTLLEGTTWYYNKIKPNFYWSVWSDYIVHKIHERVLAHIKVQAELNHH